VTIITIVAAVAAAASDAVSQSSPVRRRRARAEALRRHVRQRPREGVAQGSFMAQEVAHDPKVGELHTPATVHQDVLYIRTAIREGMKRNE